MSELETEFIPETETTLAPDTPQRILTPGRRAFLNTALAVSGVAVLHGWLAADHEDDHDTSTSSLLERLNPLLRPIEDYDAHLQSGASYANTIKEGLLTTGVAIAYSALAN